ncbi:TraR/DksA C4-type zinc finger protein [uncultured Methylophaga sp.]|uniref:TraR/DksA C4-type zinc finger protein n=1 Tax=uncultured Methylophaga sp. TaxID=285271 RepID=UPI002635ED72|nr:TraR/DksA C4-type zinc finger protein [uncultured Methylophaga sp.]
MVDLFERAQEREQKDRDIAIEAELLRGRETEQPDEEDGIRYCLDCGEEIPEDRLKARPDAVRCVYCKELKDIRSKR